jgi:hypothetical protein
MRKMWAFPVVEVVANVAPFAIVVGLAAAAARRLASGEAVVEGSSLSVHQN